jgi:hypothetical protein
VSSANTVRGVAITADNINAKRTRAHPFNPEYPIFIELSNRRDAFRITVAGHFAAR